MQTEANEFGVQPDLSTSFDAIPCMPEDFDLEQVHHHYLIYHMLYLYIKLLLQEHGAACWVAGWGQPRSNSVASDSLKSVGVNLFSHQYCMNHR